MPEILRRIGQHIPEETDPSRRAIQPLAARLRRALLLGFILLLAAASACEDPFTPTAPGEVQFSVFGYLDAAADTQWVRVMPIRPLMLTSPDSFGVRVTLQHQGTRKVIELRDSLFKFSHHLDPDLGSEGAYVHNFWTTEEIEAGASYQFTATLPDGGTAESVVRIPRDYEVEVWLKTDRYDSDYLKISGPKHVPFAAVKAAFYDRCGPGVDSVWFKNRALDGRNHSIQIEKTPVTSREGCGAPGLEGRALWMVASEDEWASEQDYDTWGLAVAERASNVTNAVGFLGGVLTRTIPYEACTFQGGILEVPAYCKLSYGPESATLLGTVNEVRCGDGLMDSVTVELREIEGEPATARKIRTTLTNRAGAFEIRALEPGVRYALKVRAKPEPDPFWGEVDVHTLHYDTLEFSAGERNDYGVLLRRLTECGVGQ